MRKNNNNNKTSKPRNTRRDDKIKSTNDPGWYASDPAILRDAASIPFSWSLGTTIPRGGEGAVTCPSSDALPGIMRVDLHPAMGLSNTADSALNTAATALYSYIRSANSGHANYFAPDLMLYCGAMAQVYSYINWCQRLYGLATMYAQKNRYMPKALLTSMGVEPDSIINNLANFRYWINVMVSKASSMAVPATMSYFSRTAFLYSNIYCESESIKDQLYYFHPASWLKFRFDSGTEAGMLENVKLKAANADGLLRLAEIQQFGEEMLGILITDEDMNIMSGDILKAYGIEHIIKLTSIDEYYPIIPICDPMVLEQIHNATLASTQDPVTVTQDPDGGYLISLPCSKHNPAVWAITSNKILSVDKVEPGPEDVIESTRLMLAGDSSRSTSEGVYYFGCGTEIAECVRIYTLLSDGTLSSSRYGSINILGTAVAWNVAKEMAKLKMFKYAPTVAYANDKNEVQCFVESIDNYAVLNPMDIYKLHDVALMNMLAVPSIAKVTRM